MSVVDVDLTGVRDSLQDLEDRARHLDRMLPEVAEVLGAAVEEVYDAEGPGWPGYAPGTHHRGKLLHDTGAMSRTEFEFGRNWASAGSSVPYARYHVTGTRYMPRRDPFDLGSGWADVFKGVEALLLDEVT